MRCALSPITMPSTRFRDQLLRSRLLYIERTALDGAVKFTLSTPMHNKLDCTLGLSNNPRPKVFSDPIGVIRLVDSWGLPQVAVPLVTGRSVTELDPAACAKIEQVLRSPRTRARRGANHSHIDFPQEWGPIGDAISKGHRIEEIAESTGIPIPTVRFIEAQLRRDPGRLSR